MCRTGPFSAYAADVWATGVCVFVFVAAKLPFWGESPGDLFDAIQNHELVLPPGLGEGMSRLLRGLLERDPDRRWTLELVEDDAW